MALRDLFGHEFCNFLKEVIKKPIIIGLLLITIRITEFIRMTICPSPHIAVDMVLLAGDFWILLLILNYTIEMVIDFYLAILKKLQK